MHASKRLNNARPILIYSSSPFLPLETPLPLPSSGSRHHGRRSADRGRSGLRVRGELRRALRIDDEADAAHPGYPGITVRKGRV